LREFGSETSSLRFSFVVLIADPNFLAHKKRPEKERPFQAMKGRNGLPRVSPFGGTNRIRFKGSHALVTLSLDS